MARSRTPPVPPTASDPTPPPEAPPWTPEEQAELARQRTPEEALAEHCRGVIAYLDHLDVVPDLRLWVGQLRQAWRDFAPDRLPPPEPEGDLTRAGVRNFALAMLEALDIDPGAPDPLPDGDGEAMMCPRDLARRFGRRAAGVKKALQRWREANKAESGRGWVEISDRAPRSAQYLYRVATVRQVVLAVAAVPRVSRQINSPR
jgi:hypothetical protein